MKAVLHFDGGSRGNPGPATGGAVLEVDGQEYEVSSFLPFATNNEAEYTGLLVGLEKSIELGIQQIHIFGDSDLVVNQVNQKWKCKKASLKALRDQALASLNKFEIWTLSWVPRNQNRKADRICNERMDAEAGIIVERLPEEQLQQKENKQKDKNKKNGSRSGNPVEEMNRKGMSASFKDWISLKVPNGRDEFTSIRLPKLIEMVTAEAEAEIERIWLRECKARGEEEVLADASRAKCYRWHLRGLSPDCAVRKVRVDLEVSANCVGR